MSRHFLTRREFFIQTSAVSTAVSFPFALTAQTLNSAGKSGAFVNTVEQPHDLPNRDTQLKFNPDGTRRSFAGNTVICHLPAQCAMRDAMTVFHDELIKAPFRHKLGLTSTESYHMTIFSGANDLDRTRTGWPSYVPLDASMAVCDQMVREKMDQAHLRCELPLRLQVDRSNTLTHPTACTLRITPVDNIEAAKLRSLRDHLSGLYGFRLKDHDQYQFHITMSYQIEPFSDSEQLLYRNMLRVHLNKIVEAAPVLELGNPEYCTFPDMFRFMPQKLLSCS